MLTILVTRKQKLLLYKAGVCPHLSWLLTTEELPFSWGGKACQLTSYYLSEEVGRFGMIIKCSSGVSPL